MAIGARARWLVTAVNAIQASGGSRKNIWGGGWPLIICEATTTKQITIEPIKNFGGLSKIWGACAPPALA